MNEQRFRLVGTVISATFILLLLLFAAVSGIGRQAATATQASVPDLVFQGVVIGSQNQTYIQVPFKVPDGTERVTLTFSFTGKDEHTALDLGLLDPAQLRCWSGGNKSMLSVGLSDATPSCLPGPIPAGLWNVLIGVPNIRSKAQSHYTVQVYFSPSGAVAREPAALRLPVRDRTARRKIH